MAKEDEIRVQLEAPRHQLPTVRIDGANGQNPPDEPAVGGYTAKELLQAPVKRPRPQVGQEERRTARFLGGIEVYGRVLILIGIGCFTISLLALLFLQAPFALALMVAGILLVVGAIVGRAFQSRPPKE